MKHIIDGYRIWIVKIKVPMGTYFLLYNNFDDLLAIHNEKLVLFPSLYYLHNFVISETGCNICSSDLFSDFRKSIMSIYKLYNTPYISYNYVKLGKLIEKGVTQKCNHGYVDTYTGSF